MDTKRISFDVPAGADDSQIPEYSLDDLLKDVTADNLHDEVDMGRPVGDEEW